MYFAARYRLSFVLNWIQSSNDVLMFVHHIHTPYHYLYKTMATRSGNAHNRLTGRIGQQQRKRIRERDNYTCQNGECGIAVNVGECDHIKSLDDGGTNEDSNLQLLCIECHKNKTAIDRGYKLTTGVDASGMPTNVAHHWKT